MQVISHDIAALMGITPLPGLLIAKFSASEGIPKRWTTHGHIGEYGFGSGKIIGIMPSVPGREFPYRVDPYFWGEITRSKARKAWDSGDVEVAIEGVFKGNETRPEVVWFYRDLKTIQCEPTTHITEIMLINSFLYHIDEVNFRYFRKFDEQVA